MNCFTQTQIDVQGNSQDAFEVYADETKEQTIAFCFDEPMARLITAAPYQHETAKEFIAGWSHFCKCIDFGKSFLDAEAIRFMNEIPARIATGIVKAEKGV